MANYFFIDIDKINLNSLNKVMFNNYIFKILFIRSKKNIGEEYFYNHKLSKYSFNLFNEKVIKNSQIYLL